MRPTTEEARGSNDRTEPPAGQLTDAETPAGTSHGGALGEYRQRKLGLAELIRALMHLAHERHDHEREGNARKLLARLAEDAFQLAVVGQFSRGKSTLMNAILGGSYLPTGALPMTSVVTTVSYGSQPRASVRRAGSPYPIDVPLEELVRFVAQQSGEREELQIVAAEVQVPAEILRLGFSFVDTPGIGSAIATNTATTMDFLPEADAVIFVTSCEAPLSDAELEFLAKVHRHVKKLFVVLNKVDLIPAADAETVARHIAGRLGQVLDSEEVRAFEISARDALASRMNGDHAGLVRSGLPAMERPLEHFLTREKTRVFLQQTSSRALGLLRQQQADLDLACAMQAQEPAARNLSAERFGEGVSELKALAHARAAEVQEQFRTRLPAALLERSRTWDDELNDTVRRLDQSAAPRATRRQLAEALSAIEVTAQPLLDDWLKRRVTEMHALLFDAAGDQIEALLACRHTVERLATQTHGLQVDPVELRARTWSPSELPPLLAGEVTFSGTLELSRWLSLGRLQDDPRRRICEALQGGVSSYCEAVRETLAQAACDWAKQLGSRVEGDIQKAADRVRGRLDTPCTDEHTALLRRTGACLIAFHDELTTWSPAPAVPEEPDVEMQKSAVSALTDLVAPCAICERIGMAAFDYLAHAQYELATRREMRAEHATSGGFCALHTWLYAQTAEPVGIALTYAELAQSAAGRLQDALQASSSEQQLRHVLAHLTPGRDRCPVCRALSMAEEHAVGELLERLGLQPERVPSLCVVHLLAVLDRHPDARQANRLAGALADAMRRAAEDMQTFALKRQSLRRGLISDEELAAYKRMIARVAGHRELARPWRTDDDDRLG
jgi:GTPase SAR1 family protein